MSEWSGPVPRPFLNTARSEYYRRAMVQFCDVRVACDQNARASAIFTPMPMTPDQVADLVARVQQSETVASVAARKASSKRWNRLHLADLEAMQRQAGVR